MEALEQYFIGGDGSAAAMADKVNDFSLINTMSVGDGLDDLIFALFDNAKNEAELLDHLDYCQRQLAIISKNVRG